jgi:drug/metabolite transporter (DMT)-like permease
MVVFFSLVAAIAFGLGAVLQKKGVSEAYGARDGLENSVSLTLFSRVARHPLWWIGAFCMLVGSIIEIQAIGMGPLNVVRPLVRAQSVVALFLGIYVLHEQMGKRDVCGALLLIIGALTLSFPSTQEHFQAHSQVQGASSTTIFAFLAIAGIAVVGSHLVRSLEVGMGIAIGCCLTAGDLLMRLATQEAGGESFDLSDGHTATQLTANLLFWASIGMGLLAFFLLQVAYTFGRVSVLSPLTSAIAILATVSAATLWLGEPISALALGGISLIVAGTLLIIA